MSPSGRELPRAVQRGDVRYAGNDSHYIEKLTCRWENQSIKSRLKQAFTPTNYNVREGHFKVPLIINPYKAVISESGDMTKPTARESGV